MRYVIIGNSISGVSAIEAIRELDKTGVIQVVSDEPFMNYSRPLISYYLGKKIGAEKMSFRQKDFYSENNVELMLETKAEKIDIKENTVLLSGGRKIYYDKLLICTGGSPIIPEIKGLKAPGVFTFTKFSDAKDIEKYIKANKVKSAVVIGAGLIGLKATEGLLELGIRINIVELADRILSATFDKKASSIIEVALEKAGCNIFKQNTATEIRSKNNKVSGVILKDKNKISSELVIAAIGVKPNLELVSDTGIKTSRGILVDNFMMTSVKDIYTAGDCVEAKDTLLNLNRNLAIWPVAAKQGRIAGYNMAGKKKEYSGSFAMNSVELCSIPTISVGITEVPTNYVDNYEVIEDYRPLESIYRKIVLKNNTIAGVIFVGKIERAGIYTGLIEDKVDVSEFKDYLLKDDFGLISLPKEYRKHLVSGSYIEV